MELELIKEKVMNSSRLYKDEFINICGGFEDRGILNSEMLAVCSLSESLGIQVFIESGRWKGQSTEVLSRYFSNKPVIIESIELYRDENADYVEKKMKDNKNVNLLYGDANDVIPKLVKKYAGKKIAILFDGPKGRQAMDVFQLSFANSNSVVVGFFHDMRRATVEMPNLERGAMEKIFTNSFFTDDKEFVDEFKHLDNDCQTALWKPYSIDNKKIGSYGPTIGIFFPEQGDLDNANSNYWVLYWKTRKRWLFSRGVKIYHFFLRCLGR